MEEKYKKEVLDVLYKYQDEKYKKFNLNLFKENMEDEILGVRIPVLRTIVKNIVNDKNKSANTNTNTNKDFIEYILNKQEYRYNEEKLIRAFLINKIKQPDKIFLELEKFMPYITNWAVCDAINPKELKKHPKELLDFVLKHIYIEDEYTQRLYVYLLMNNFLDENFNEEIFKIILKIDSDKYYVLMMIGWFFQKALVKQKEITLKYLESSLMKDKYFKYAYKKIRESKAIDNDTKTIVEEMI